MQNDLINDALHHTAPQQFADKTGKDLSIMQPIVPKNAPEFSSLTFSERARFSESSNERSAWEVAQDLQNENKSLLERLWQLEADREEVKSLLRSVSDELDNMRHGLQLDSVVETGVVYCEKLTQKAELLLSINEPKGTH